MKKIILIIAFCNILQADPHIIEYLQKLEKGFIHGKNMLAKIHNNKGFKDEQELQKFFKAYGEFNKELVQLCKQKKKDFSEITDCLNKYKNFASKENRFSSQSKYESTIIEEFLFVLLRDLIDTNKLKIGSAKVYSSFYFSPKNIKNFLEETIIKINQKDQDFSIYRDIKIKAENKKYNINVPVVSIECKTYLDKTMLEGNVATADKIKAGNPHCKFFIVTETYDVDYKVDISSSRIDNIFVLRKQKRIKKNAKQKPIATDVIEAIYNEVKNHLKSEWRNTKDNIEKFGKIII